jgi:hypothetical protein
VAKGWILVTECDQSKKRKELELKTMVRIAAIDVIHERGSYTTLRIRGSFMHVEEKFADLVELMEKGELDG